MRVLIVDDEKLIRDVIKEYCIGNNYDVLQALKEKAQHSILK